MKKLLVFLLVALLAVPMMGVVAQVPTADLTELAASVPADQTVFFGAVRTDDGFIETLDAALSPFYPLADDLPPNFTLEMGLDLAVQEAGLGDSFSTAVRPWLGDTAALAVFIPEACTTDPATCDLDAAFDDDADAVFMFSVRDAAAANETITALAAMDNTEFTTEQRGVFTVYSDAATSEVVAISDALALIADTDVLETYNLLNRDFAPLSNNADMTEALALMPNAAAGYNAVGYVNMPLITETIGIVAEANPSAIDSEDAATLALLEDIYDSITFGAVILDGNTFTVDVAMPLGLEMPDLGAVTPGFLANIPATTPLLIHSTNLAGAYTETLDFIERLAAEDPETNPDDIRTGLAFADNILQGFVGLTIDDMIGWITGDYALIVNGSESLLNADGMMSMISENPVDLAFIADASADPAAAVAVVDGLQTFLEGDFVTSITDREDAEFALETSREGDVLNVAVLDLTGEVPFPLEISAGVQNNLFFIATPSIIQDVTSGDGGLATTQSYTNADGVILPGSNQVYYVDFTNIMPFLQVAQQIDPGEEDIANAITIVELLESATISTATDSNNVYRYRMTVTLK